MRSKKRRTFNVIDEIYAEYLLISAESREDSRLCYLRACLWAELLPFARAYLIRQFDRMGITLTPASIFDLQVDLVAKVLTVIDESAMTGSPGGRRKPVKKIRNFSGLLYWSASNLIRDHYRRERRWLEQTAVPGELERHQGKSL